LNKLGLGVDSELLEVAQQPSYLRGHILVFKHVLRWVTIVFYEVFELREDITFKKEVGEELVVLKGYLISSVELILRLQN